MNEIQLQMLKIWNSDPEDICAVEVGESQTFCSLKTTVLSSTESLKPTQRKQIKPESPLKVTADHVVDEFRSAAKTCCGRPNKDTMKTTLITLLFGVLPSSRDLFIDFNLGLSCIMKGDYIWGGKKHFKLFSFEEENESANIIIQTQLARLFVQTML